MRWKPHWPITRAIGTDGRSSSRYECGDREVIRLGELVVGVIYCIHNGCLVSVDDVVM